MRPFLVAALLCGFGDAVASAQWQLQAIKSDADFRGLCAVGPTVAWVSGTKGTFGRTADGGKTWTAGTVADAEKLDFQAGADSAGAFSIAFRDRNHGVIVGGDYLKPDSTEATGAVTADGGKTWTLIKAPLPFRSGISWAKDRWVAVGTSGSDASVDDGANWKNLDRGRYNSVSFSATGDGWAVGPKGRIAKFVKADK